MNSYLKEIVDLCGIRKNLIMYIVWYSFVSVIVLVNNVLFLNVFKMLGYFFMRMI